MSQLICYSFTASLNWGGLVKQFDKVLVVANPISGLGKAGRWLDWVVRKLRRSAKRVEVMRTGQAGDGHAAASELRTGANLIVSFGGDGTFNEVLNGADLELCTLAVIPAGAGNVLGFELGMSTYPQKAVRQILEGREERFDLAICNGRRFVSMFGAGLDARAVELAHEKRRGFMTHMHYALPILRGTIECAGYGIKVRLDGRPLGSGLGQVVVGNTHSYGGRIELTPAASPQDGLLDVMCVKAEFARMFGGFPHTMFRTVHNWRGITYARGRRVEIQATASEVPFELDGEAAGHLPAVVEILPRAVRLRAPRTFCPIQRCPPVQEP